jgi:hypothetical protein
MWNQDSYFEVTAPAVVPITSNATNGEGGWFGVAGGGSTYSASAWSSAHLAISISCVFTARSWSPLFDCGRRK